MARRRAKAAVLVLARENKIDGFIPGQGIRTFHEMQWRQAPVYAIQAQMLGIPVFDFISTLSPASEVVCFLFFLCLGVPLEEARTVSKLLMYSTCFSTHSSNGDPSSVPPPRPGPDTKDIAWEAHRECQWESSSDSGKEKKNKKKKIAGAGNPSKGSLGMFPRGLGREMIRADTRGSEWDT